LIKIGFAGTLGGFSPNNSNKGRNSLKEWIWEYRHNYEYSQTRSGYFLFKGIEFLKNKYNIGNNQLSVELWGNINNLNKVQVLEFKIEDIVTISGYKTKAESDKLLNDCDILFLPLELNPPSHRSLFIPGKVFEYLKLSKPILILSEQGDCLDIVKKSGLAINCNPTDSKEIASKLLRLINNNNHLESIKPNIEYIQSCKAKNRIQDLAKVFDSLT